jgi:hypothetical protein
MMKGNLWQQTASTHRCGEAVIGHRADSCPLRQVKSPCNSWSLAVCCLVSSRQPPDENAAPTPTCFAEIGSDDFPILHLMSSVAPFRRTAWLSYRFCDAGRRRDCCCSHRLICPAFSVQSQRVFEIADHSGADRTSDRAGAARE